MIQFQLFIVCFLRSKVLVPMPVPDCQYTEGSDDEDGSGSEEEDEEGEDELLADDGDEESEDEKAPKTKKERRRKAKDVEKSPEVSMRRTLCWFSFHSEPNSLQIFGATTSGLGPLGLNSSFLCHCAISFIEVEQTAIKSA